MPFFVLSEPAHKNKMHTDEEIRKQTEHADELFKEINTRMAALKENLMNLNEMIDSMRKKTDDPL
jgi:ABC-type transporter Mla subunit MlaD